MSAFKMYIYKEAWLVISPLLAPFSFSLYIFTVQKRKNSAFEANVHLNKNSRSSLFSLISGSGAGKRLWTVRYWEVHFGNTRALMSFLCLLFLSERRLFAGPALCSSWRAWFGGFLSVTVTPCSKMSRHFEIKLTHVFS